MRHLTLLFAILFVFNLHAQQKSDKMSSDFVYIKDYIPNIVVDLRYYGTDNFVGKQVDGYKSDKAIFTKTATNALIKVEKELNKQNLGLKIFDAYRPQQAVNHFQSWAKDVSDTITKQKYYPSINKKNLFKDGYIASKSGHSRGSTIDLTIIDLTSKKELDMGTIFDFLGPESAHDYTKATRKQKENRALLKSVMKKYGFKPYSKEWWHYTFINEPFKNTYFDFPVK